MHTQTEYHWGSTVDAWYGFGCSDLELVHALAKVIFWIEAYLFKLKQIFH
jgi:hypothetical protein